MGIESMEILQQPRLKIITRRDFESVKTKYHYIEDKANKIIQNAEPLDVLILKTTPGSGLKILDARIINESSEEQFSQILKEGVFNIQ